MSRLRRSLRSAWVIWPTFSASVIRPSRSSTRGRDRQARILVGKNGVGGCRRGRERRDGGRRDEAGHGRGDRDEGEQWAATVDGSSHDGAPCMVGRSGVDAEVRDRPPRPAAARLHEPDVAGRVTGQVDRGDLAGAGRRHRRRPCRAVGAGRDLQPARVVAGRLPGPQFTAASVSAPVSSATRSTCGSRAGRPSVSARGAGRRPWSSG